MDALGWESAHVVGHDWGAIVAWEVAARHPAHVRSLTAVSVPHPRAFGAALANDPAQRQMSAYMQFFRADPAKAAAVLLADGAAALRQVYGDAVHHLDVETYVERFSEPGALEASLYWYAAMGRMDTPEVSVPTTFLWGSGDIAIGSAAAHGCAEFCTGAFEFRPLDGIGHWVPDQAPDAVVDAILARVG
jgi:pimeloyl-ACP methyl ester carboxylesterase